MAVDEAPVLLTTEEAAALLRRPPGTLKWWRRKRIGPPSFRSGRHVFYAREDVLRWLAEGASTGRTRCDPDAPGRTPLTGGRSVRGCRTAMDTPVASTAGHHGSGRRDGMSAATELDEALAEVDHATLVSMAASGLVQLAWRVSPVEAAHGSRRGPSDGEMMAESIHLHRVANDLLRTGDRSWAWKFEDHLLNLERTWTGTSRTVRDMLYGHLGAFRRHVRTTLAGLWGREDESGREPLLRELAYWAEPRHFGMPRWAAIADRTVDLIMDPGDPSWDGRGHRLTVYVPQRLRDRPEELRTALREDPLSLGVDALDGLIDSGVFYVV